MQKLNAMVVGVEVGVEVDVVVGGAVVALPVTSGAVAGGEGSLVGEVVLGGAVGVGGLVGVSPDGAGSLGGVSVVLGPTSEG